MKNTKYSTKSELSDGSYSVLEFEYIITKYETLVDDPPIQNLKNC